MLATKWYGKEDIRVERHQKPMVTEAFILPAPKYIAGHPAEDYQQLFSETYEGDALLRITSTAICGSDLHMYTGFMPGMKPGDIVGHEFMGIIEDVGPNVKNFRKGDRVIAAFDLACGHCFFCKQQLQSCCDNTNPSVEMEKLYGDKLSGFYGYSHLTGGYAGGQAEYARVFNADVNLLKVPDDLSLPDERLLFLSDILTTAWHANELGQVSKGDKVAIWGAGPVGMLASRLAQIRGAKQVILIDNIEYRLKYVQEKVPGVEVINFDKHTDVVTTLKEMTTHGPDVGIDAVGCHYTKKSWTHTLETKLGLETDSGDVINEVIKAVRKGGRISVIGVYVATVNHFNLGAFFEKGMSMAGGQTPCQKYWPKCLELIKSGAIDPSFVITHRLPLAKAAEGYKIFNNKLENCVKCVLKPGVKA